MTEPGKGHPACPLAVLVAVSHRVQDLLPCKGPTQPRAPAPATRTSPAPCSRRVLQQSWEGSFWGNRGRKPARLKLSPSPAPGWALPSCCMFWCSEWCCEGIQGNDPPRSIQLGTVAPPGGCRAGLQFPWQPAELLEPFRYSLKINPSRRVSRQTSLNRYATYGFINSSNANTPASWWKLQNRQAVLSSVGSDGS